MMLWYNAITPVVLISRWKWFIHKMQYDVVDIKCINSLHHHLSPTQLSLNAINMMQCVVDSPLNLQLDNYYLINKGEISYGKSFHDTTNWLRECLSDVENDYYTPRNTFSSIVERGILWWYNAISPVVLSHVLQYLSANYKRSVLS